LPENPLLPNRRLKQLLEMMQRARALDLRASKIRSSKLLPREALLAATAIHLEPGDILSADPSDSTAPTFAPAPKPNSLVTWSAVVEPDPTAPPPQISRLALSAATAAGLRVAGAGGIVLHLTSSSDPAWPASLDYAQRALLPLIIAVADPTSGTASRNRTGLTLPAVTAAAKKLKLPVIPVDGEDAVAVYRVMQECLLRARLGEGPAVIWGLLNPDRLTRSTQPIARMETYLSARGLLTSKATRRSLA
jgi:pyruvate dehydrogenase E1 component alpha subunit